MSANMMGEIWKLDITQPEAWVLMAMADHADYHGEHIFSGHELLAWKTNYTTRQISRIINDLIEKEIVILVEGPIGRGHPREYRLNLDAAPRKLPPPDPGNVRRDRIKRLAVGQSKTRQNVPLSDAPKVDILSSIPVDPKVDILSGLNDSKVDILSAFQDEKGRHFRGQNDPKVDIFDQNMNMNARAFNQEREPRERENTRTAANVITSPVETSLSFLDQQECPFDNFEQDHNAKLLDAMEKYITAVYELDSPKTTIDKSASDAIRREAVKLAAEDCTIPLLKEFFDEQITLRPVQFIHSNWHTWRVNRKRQTRHAAETSQQASASSRIITAPAGWGRKSPEQAASTQMNGNHNGKGR